MDGETYVDSDMENLVAQQMKDNLEKLGDGRYQIVIDVEFQHGVSRLHMYIQVESILKLRSRR